MEHKGTHTIETERLILRRIRHDDAQAMFDNWTSDPEVTRFLSWPTHESVKVSQAIADMWENDYEKPDSYQWAFTLKDGDDKPFGTIGVVHIYEGINAMEIGYCIGRNFWHQGYTSEALEGVIGWLFENIDGLERIEARHDARNPNSGRVMKHAGMQYEGTRRKGDLNNSGIHDCCGYAILREDYEKRKNNGAL